VHEENTLEALEEALDAGGRAVELDVRRTRDHRWVLNHDPTLERLHGLPDSIADLTLEELRVRAPLPPLEEALALFDGRRSTPLVEVKETAAVAVEPLAALLRAHARENSVVAIARGEEMPAELLRRLPEVPLLLYNRDWDDAWRRRGEGFAGFDLYHEGVAERAIEKRLGRFLDDDRKVALFTINDRARCARLLEAGATWVITDLPWKMADLRGGLEEPGAG
ncbi:MAG: glycerophosphodiester phosphodiesterase, partial [Planctomycetota bacterium]